MLYKTRDNKGNSIVHLAHSESAAELLHLNHFGLKFGEEVFVERSDEIPCKSNKCLNLTAALRDIDE